MRPTEDQLAKLTDLAIRGLAGLLGFSGAIKGFVKAELPAAFLAALDKKCGGEIPPHVWRIGRARTTADSLESLKQRVAAAEREMDDVLTGRKRQSTVAAAREAEDTAVGRKWSTKAGPSRGLTNPLDPLDAEPPPQRRSERLARRERTMDLDDSDSANESSDGDGDHPSHVDDAPSGAAKTATFDCFTSLSADLSAVQKILDQVHRIATSKSRSKELAIVGLQDEIADASATLRRLRTGLEVGKVTQAVKDMKNTIQQTKKDQKKAPSYAEAARRGLHSAAPQVRRTPVWSTSRTFFLRPENEAVHKQEIPAWRFGAKLREKFGSVPTGGDPPLLRLHRTARGEWQMLVAAWARDQLVSADQNRVDFQEYGFWILERREVMSGPSAVVSQVPLELSDEEIKQGLLEGSKSLLEPQVSELMKAVRVQRLKRREISTGDSRQSSWVPGKSVRVIFPADELRQKFLGLGGIYLFWQYVPIREYVPPTYYCSICKKRGGHSTQYHRGPAPQGP